jgi:hypothetical protein
MSLARGRFVKANPFPNLFRSAEESVFGGGGELRRRN